MNTRPAPAAAARGFTLVECLAVCAVVAILSALALPSLRGQQLRAGRWDAVEALTRVQRAQEQYRSLHGLYAGDLTALRGAAAASPQERYRITLSVIGPEIYLASATARGAQAGDRDCDTLTLEVTRGFPREGPTPACWMR
jgi:type IV pilus assembly protein PilE